ncbi:T6SS phospholipase effector Tle1-like catalytic domain-containing protein [Flavobacterium hydatis]|uniref:T6SS Phospholipase effector Tle1-like catalytic domain-containing protein n=1 Tax=Flavobacterium hydatis TaxID=991 RepID=A0A086ATE5_FLAHY|nr:DUF2235 domain-containing protein [Flavobacterium hydatis]KFF19959.1 hypothetical protein IW20_02185 [Flavobacterium hydatis]OXA91476.1 hypothetical protein B0A62_17520 [Flavobacterium hydatis]
MGITRIIGGTLTKTAKGNIDIRATKGDVNFIAAEHNNWHGEEGGIIHHDYEPLHPVDSLKKSITITLNIFFDGTQNNKTNTEKGKDHKKSNHEDDSFTNDFSNVARGYDAIDPTSSFQKALYIEGIGTEDLESDDVFPDIAIGMGDRGVVAKVIKACVKAPERLEKYKDDEIDILFVNVYGFSRGAAAARHFLYVANSAAIIEATQDDTVLIKAPGTYQGMKSTDFYFSIPSSPLLGKHGYFAACLLKNEFNIKSIQINFVGLYDTVSSHGFYHGNDVKDLHLTAIKKARFALQLSADDEYRENFDLTDITSAGLRGLELTLPGVHSDIGGSYPNNATEI